MKNNKNGSVLAVVFICTAIIIVIVASLLSLMNTQRKLAIKKELMLQAYQTAENSADYAYSYVVNDINVHTINGASSIPTTGYRSFAFTTAPKNFLAGAMPTPDRYSDRISVVGLSDPDVRVLPPGEKKRLFINGAMNPGDPNRNQYVQEQLIPVVSRATASQSGQAFTGYVQKAISSRELALFQYAIFFQGQLHLHRGFNIMGGVHANGNLFINAHDGDYALYNGAVSSAHHIYRGSTFDLGGSGSDPFGYVAVTSEESGGWADATTTPRFAPSARGTTGQIRIYVDTVDGVDNNVTFGNLDCRTRTWKDDASRLYNTKLEDAAMQSPLLSPVGTSGYAQDVAATDDVNEFNNAPYTLLEPTLPTSNDNHQSSLMNNFEAKASLIFIVEFNSEDTIYLHQISDGAAVKFTSATDLNPTTNAAANLSLYSDPWRMFIVKAYKVKPEWEPSLGTDIHARDGSNAFLYLTPITLPTQDYHVIGRASADCSRIIPGKDLLFEDFDVALSGSGAASLAHSEPLDETDSQQKPIVKLNTSAKDDLDTEDRQIVTVNSGLFDARLGRGVAPITIDIDALKKAFEVSIATLTPNTNANPDYLFRTEFDPTAILTSGSITKAQWNGLIYIEFPTSLTLQNTAVTASAPLWALNDKNGKRSRQFAYSTVAELLHPDRWDTTDNLGRASRTDKIVPMAPQLRRYPPAAQAAKNSVILDAQYALPAVQIINGAVLPHPNPGRGVDEGFSIATNAPLYLVGNYNSDGNCATGTNFASTSPTAYAVADNASEIPAAFFCDTFTTLSNGWGATPSGNTKSNRQNSFYGANSGASSGTGSTTGSPGNIGDPPGRPCRPRPADTASKYTAGPHAGYLYPASGNYVEISACVATGEYPIFEFFNHAVEDFASLYNIMDATHPNPIVFKGSVVALFHSEVQHIKQAYGRNVNKDIQVYYAQHGKSAICAVRFHDFLVHGHFPPGTPMMYVTHQKDYRLLRWADATDAALLTQAGYTN